LLEILFKKIFFLKDITPWLTRMAKDVDARSAELTHQVHREILVRCTDSVKILSPILICAMKVKNIFKLNFKC